MDFLLKNVKNILWKRKDFVTLFSSFNHPSPRHLDITNMSAGWAPSVLLSPLSFSHLGHSIFWHTWVLWMFGLPTFKKVLLHSYFWSTGRGKDRKPESITPWSKPGSLPSSYIKFTTTSDGWRRHCFFGPWP